MGLRTIAACAGVITPVAPVSMTMHLRCFLSVKTAEYHWVHVGFFPTRLLSPDFQQLDTPCVSLGDLRDRGRRLFPVTRNLRWGFSRRSPSSGAHLAACFPGRPAVNNRARPTAPNVPWWFPFVTSTFSTMSAHVLLPWLAGSHSFWGLP